MAQVQKAFGPDGAKAKSAAEVRLVLPKNFDSDFRGVARGLIVSRETNSEGGLDNHYTLKYVSRETFS